MSSCLYVAALILMDTVSFLPLLKAGSLAFFSNVLVYTTQHTVLDVDWSDEFYASFVCQVTCFLF